MLGDDREHLLGLAILEHAPAQVAIGPAAVLADAILALGEDHPLDRLAERRRAVLLALLGVIQPTDEQEVGDLLDHLERVGDAAGPERIPHRIDLAPEFTCKHALYPSLETDDHRAGHWSDKDPSKPSSEWDPIYLFQPGTGSQPPRNVGECGIASVSSRRQQDERPLHYP